MRRIKTTRTLLLLFKLVIGTTLCRAQTPPTLPLRTVLDEVEQRYAVQFSYMDRSIDSVEVAPPPNNSTLAATLAYLAKATGLEFIQLDDRYISIKVKTRAGNICGYLYDAEFHEPIANAAVFSGEVYTTTDEQGYFELPSLTELGILKTQHLSYQPLLLRFDTVTTECPTFLLTPAINTLKEVVISNYLTRGISKKEGGALVVNAPYTNLLPGMTEPDVFFVLKNLPGIQSAKSSITEINIRGGSHDQNLILWDGIKLYQAGHFFGLISSINPNLVGTSTLIKNGTPAALGEGTSGTLMVETRGRESDHISVQAGSNLLNGEVLVEVPLEKLHLLIASRQSIGGLINTPTYQRYFDRAFGFSEVVNDPNSMIVNSDERFRFYDYSAHATYTPNAATTLKGGFFYLDNGIQYRENLVRSGRLDSKVSNLDQSTLAGFLAYQHRWSDRFRWRVYGSIMNYQQESLNVDLLIDQEHQLENEVLEETLKLEADYYASDALDFSGGLQWTETGIRQYRNISQPGFRSLSREVMRTLSAYAQSRIRLHPSTYLNLGLRSSYFDYLNQFRVEPRLALTSQLGKLFSVELLAESKSQTTVQVVDFETDFLGIENRKWVLVNGEDIPLLTSSQASVGIMFQPRSLLISLEGFLKKVDGVVTASQGFLNQFQYTRTAGSYTAQGFEVLINPQFEQLDAWLTYSFLDSDYSFPTLNPETFRNNFDITHTLSVGATYRWKQLELSSGVNFRSGNPFTTPEGVIDDELIEFGMPNNASLPAYFRLDVSARYKFSLSERWKISCGASVWNLTNRQNIINTFPSVTEDGNLSLVNQNALGITPNLNLRLHYSKAD